MKSMEHFARALKKGVALVAISGFVGIAGVSAASAEDMSAEDKAQVEAALEQLRAANLADPSNARVAFARALTAKKLGYTGEAIRVLEQITSNNSGMARAELELAVLYYQTGDYEKARPLFESASQAESATPELKERIGQYVEAIDRRLQTSITAGNAVVGIGWQSNANGGSDEFANIVNALEAAEEDDFNAFVSGGLSHIQMIGDSGRATWESVGKLYASKQLDVDEVDAIFTEIGSGVRFMLGTGEDPSTISLKPYVKVNYLFLGSDSYNLGASAGALLNFKLGKQVVLGTGYEYTLQTYFNSGDPNAPKPGERPNAEEREGDEHQFTVSLGYLMSKETTLTFKGDYFINDTDFDYWTNDAYQVSARVSHIVGGTPLPGTLPMSISGGVAWYNADYDGPSPANVNPNNATRDDERWTFDVGAVVPFTDSIGITGAVSYTMQDSAVELYEYDNLRVILGAAFAF